MSKSLEFSKNHLKSKIKQEKTPKQKLKHKSEQTEAIAAFKNLQNSKPIQNLHHILQYSKKLIHDSGSCKAKSSNEGEVAVTVFTFCQATFFMMDEKVFLSFSLSHNILYVCLRFPCSTVYALSRITTDNYDISSNETFLIKRRKKKKELSKRSPLKSTESKNLFRFFLISLENEKKNSL